jgi:uncharacterized membrane protein
MDRTSYRRAIFVIVVGYAAGCVWFGLPANPPAVSQPMALTTRALIAFLLPTAAAVLLWLFRVIEVRRPVCAREPGDCAATARIVVQFVIFIEALHGLVILRLSEGLSLWPWAPRLPFVLVGALLVSVGNLLPTTRPNVIVGIRTPRSLRSRAFWMEINRVGGNVAVGLGLIVIVAAVMLGYPLVGQVISAAVVSAIAIVVFRYCRLVHGEQR